mgnify:FL=1
MENEILKNSRNFNNLNGIQINPLSFLDEGIDNVLDILKNRFHINAIFVCTVSWLGLKIGRSISHEIDGWPDHGTNVPIDLSGGAFFRPNLKYYENTKIKEFYTKDRIFKDIDILKDIIISSKKRNIKVYIELMEPFFKYEGHGSVQKFDIPNISSCLEIDLYGRTGTMPSTLNPDYRNWIKAIIEDHCKSYEIDGIMWCNERCSPLDQLIQGLVPTDFSKHSIAFAANRNIDYEKIKYAFLNVFNYFNSKKIHSDNFIDFISVILENPEILIWEKLWLENNKNLDKELYGLVKWINKDIEFGLNVWNRNHFSLLRKAQWPWSEVLDSCDWVKPITYQHQGGVIYKKEMSWWTEKVLSKFEKNDVLKMFNKVLNMKTSSWDDLYSSGLSSNQYVSQQCLETVQGVSNSIPVYMGIGVDAPGYHISQQKCSPKIVYDSVISSYKSGASGVIYSPNYSFMNFYNLDGSVKALKKLKYVK